MERVILENTDQKTTDEICLEMVKGFERAFNTGPIIGESRRLVLHLAHNLYQRDLFIEALGYDVEKREKVFKITMDLADKKDAEILKNRTKKG